MTFVRKALSVLTVASCWLSVLMMASCRPTSEAPPPSQTTSKEPSVGDDTPEATVELRPRMWKEIDDPRQDGWESEVFNDRSGAVLKTFGKWIAHPEDIDPSEVAAMVTEDFRSSPLYPLERRTIYDKNGIRVSIAAPSASPTTLSSPGSTPTRTKPNDAETERSDATKASERLLGRLRELRASLGEAVESRAAFKTVRVDYGATTAATTSLVSVAGFFDGGAIEQHAEWHIEWAIPAGEATPRVARIELRGFEETVSRTTSGTLFREATASILGPAPEARDQFSLGMNHWLERIQDQRFFALLGTPGLALGDVNGDGLDDIYVAQEGGLPNRLLLARPDGTVVDGSSDSGIDWLESTRSALLVDLDSDGHQDLAAAVLGNLVLARGQGNGKFAVRTILPTSHDTMSLVAADADRDGDLDLFLCAYNADDLTEEAGAIAIGAGTEFVYHDAESGAANLFFLNGAAEGDPWVFRDATAESGLDQNNRRFSFAAAWDDFDNDGDVDLYVANDFGRNNLYRNETAATGGLQFTDIGESMGAEDRASGMSVSWADYDLDGFMDLYVGNMFSSAGGRVTHQDGFKANAPVVRERLQRFARGNTLLHNLRGERFEDISEVAAATMGRWAWSSPFVDLNNDGWEDIVVANGYITTDDTSDL